MSERVPEGWRYNSIAECCEILDSQRIPLNSEERSKRLGEYPYYGANGIQGYIDDFIFDGDAILVAEDGGNFDQYAERPIAQWVTGKYWVNNHAHILRAKENDLDKWIFYSLVHKNILKFINGGTRAKLNQSDLREIQISLPPLPEQKKIASILTSVDEVIETTQKQIDKLQDLKKATMNELLTKGIGHTEFKDSELGRIPKSWGINQLGDYVKCQGGNAFPSSEFGKIGIPVVRISNIKNGLVDLSGCVHFSESEQFKRFIVFEGEILLAMSGATTGKIGVYKAKSPAYLNQRVGRFRIEDKKNVDSAFLNHLVQSEIFADATLRDAIGGAQPNISSSQVESVIYAFPTLSEQKVIASILNSVDHKIDVQNAKLNQTQSLKKSLMQDLLTGKVRVQVN